MGIASSVTVVVAVTEPQAPAPVTRLLMVYTPGTEVASVTTPVVGFIVRPAGIALNAPAVLPAPSVGASMPGVPAHPMLVVYANAPCGAAESVRVCVCVAGQVPPTE